jgi:uncharacterized protein
MTKEFAVFPLGTAYLPGERIELNVFETRYLDLLNDVLSAGRQFVSVLISRGSEVGGGDERFALGVLIDIDAVLPLDNALRLEGRATAIVDVVSWLPDNPYPRASVELRSTETLSSTERIKVARSLSLTAQRLRTLLEKISDTTSASRFTGAVQSAVATIASGRWWHENVSEAELDTVFWQIARCVPCGPMDRLDLLRAGPVQARVQQLELIIEHVSELIEFHAGS